ncbi:MAG: DNA mismatch repair endonuclease MutL [Clostridia bacterium]|nr:DNA mismatch repair endonuclease MutL [Clostridia bacterium]
MSVIRVLKPQVANQIAAGEVVERPASVVKELVENAIDAGATAVTVRIENGGMRSITVTDNGCGIAREDCRNAFLRHATSKISTAEDLSHVTTLGFRGEALASIASVSRVTMTTRQADADVGTKLLIDNGVVVSEEDSPCVFGTTFVVEELFASVPARLKFLKSARTEAGYIGDYIGKMILARPEISFRYEADGKTVYETYGDGNLYNAVFCVYGATVAEKLVNVDYDNGYMKVEGYLGLPEISRNNRTFQTLFINGRSIRSASVSAAVAQAYDTRLMIGRFPFFVLNLSLAPQEVDVNVHPTKAEVRFADENRVFTGVSAAAKLALGASEKHVESAFDHVVPKQPEIPEASFAPHTPISVPRVDFHEYAVKGGPSSYREGNYNTFREKSSSGSVPSFTVRTDSAPEIPKAEAVSPLFTDEPIDIVGCVFRTYWIVTCGQNMFLIDQHAAHERKLYEELSSRKTELSSQQLLVPREVTLTPSEITVWETHPTAFTELGFGLTRSGATALTLSEVPVLNGQMLNEAYLHAVLSILSEYGKDVKNELVRERMMQSACKHAIKGGEPVSREEISALIAQFMNGEIPLTCPHGRPVVVRISETELEKMFRRIV